ncbi:MHS family MFS transporter [Amycolatopsis acidicola]|uniref:Putative proline/betaine transporter n=1 Tax=Amycolatopsis acidicola TaxID=2596893 RepID=A0A5N0USV2_9PSEU|nr:MFS transporter [Amycolatopsis acidicola]KAA9153962.1 MHS family MFS transporter [Amycolatopsis acidicola]
MREETLADAPPETPEGRAKLARRAAVASLVGTAVEWYDYFIFGTASALVFGKLFFPSQSSISGTLSAFAVFGVGFVARPVGGIVFGHIGDRLGRKGALITTLLLMGGATFLMGALPTTEHVGILAPILLVLLRIVQGFGVGGEWGGASLVAVEYAPEGKRGAYGSFPQVGNAIGLVISTGAFALVSMLPDDQLLAWGWRIPFLASIVLVLVGLLIRVKLTETPAFVAAQKMLEEKKTTKDKLPLATVLRQERRPLLITMALRLGEGIFGYILLTFVLTYATNYTDIAKGDMLLASTIAAAVGIVTFYLLGKLSDRIGRRPVYILGAALGIVTVFPLFWILDTNSVPLAIVAVTVTYAIGVGAMYAVEPSMFSELFATTTRYTGVSLAAQIPSILVGAWPYAATALLIATGGNPWPVVLITAVVLALGIWAALAAPETNRKDIVAHATTGEGA